MRGGFMAVLAVALFAGHQNVPGWWEVLQMAAAVHLAVAVGAACRYARHRALSAVYGPPKVLHSSRACVPQPGSPIRRRES